jgi:hypothetical protein
LLEEANVAAVMLNAITKDDAAAYSPMRAVSTCAYVGGIKGPRLQESKNRSGDGDRGELGWIFPT